MEVRAEILWMIIGSALVTVLPRVLPLIFLSRFQLPDWALRFLQHIPVAVMAALLAQAILTNNDQLLPLANNENLLAMIPAIGVAIFTRSLLGTVLAGIAAIFLLRLMG